MYQYDSAFNYGDLVTPPILLRRFILDEFNHLPDEIKESIEEHKNEIYDEKDLMNFIRIQKYKS